MLPEDASAANSEKNCLYECITIDSDEEKNNAAMKVANVTEKQKLRFQEQTYNNFVISDSPNKSRKSFIIDNESIEDGTNCIFVQVNMLYIF